MQHTLQTVADKPSGVFVPGSAVTECMCTMPKTCRAHAPWLIQDFACQKVCATSHVDSFYCIVSKGWGSNALLYTNCNFKPELCEQVHTA